MPIFEAKQHTESKREYVYRGGGSRYKANKSTVVNIKVKATEAVVF